MKRCSRLYGSSFCGALLLLAPALAAAQDPVPAPKRETVTIRGVSGTFELKGTSSADLFEFTQCGSKSVSSGSTVLLTLPLEIEAGPNDSIEHATTLLREAVAKGLLTIVEPSGEPGRRVMVVWSGGLPEFMGVIESVSTKYTMFLPNGTPVRATASVRVKEADKASMKQGGSKETDKSDSKKEPDCTSVKQ